MNILNTVLFWDGLNRNYGLFRQIMFRTINSSRRNEKSAIRLMIAASRENYDLFSIFRDDLRVI